MSFTNMNNVQVPSLGFERPAFGGSAVIPTSQVEMTLSCENLLNTDVLSKSDPFCIVSMKEPWQEKFFEIGRTEQINDNLNPKWVKKFIVDYNFESVQKVRFEVWDVDPEGNDYLGEYETTLADIVAYSGRQFRGKLKHTSNRDAGAIVVVTEELSSCKQSIEFGFRGRHLEKLMWFIRNDPFLVFSRSNEDGSFSVVLKTEVDHSTQNPRWRPMKTSARTLCNGDYDRNIKIECFDKRSNGDDKLIGVCYTSLRNLSKGVGDDTKYTIRHPKKQNSKESSGVIELVSIVITEEVSFLDYIRGGTQMHFAVAIDFTASNGAPTDPRSLHFMSPSQPNSYEIALRSVGEIIQHYDTSRMYPAFGFGARLPPTGDVSHQFPLNGNPSHPYCSGIDEILTHYRSMLSQAQLYGPTNFSPVINNTISIAKQFQDGKHFFVLLIITDGIISDMHATINAIIDASKLPISIIIVGVGEADFEAMDVLDSDDTRLSIDGRRADRDIVQFVPMNRFLTHRGQFVKSQAELAKAVLAEIPDQMTGYMKARGYAPGPRIPPDASKLVATAPLA